MGSIQFGDAQGAGWGRASKRATSIGDRRIKASENDSKRNTQQTEKAGEMARWMDEEWWEEAAERVGRIAVEQIREVTPRSRAAVCLCPLPTTNRRRPPTPHAQRPSL